MDLPYCNKNAALGDPVRLEVGCRRLPDSMIHGLSRVLGAFAVGFVENRGD